ncbi:uncharacterized protein [Apostichopus japonicus]|uniref:uncharacterized protein n=1 Tax=Stichopus japonicus TaxID=307972 RepID=UPI003AB7833A
MPQCQGCLNRRGEEGAGKGKRYYVIPDGKRFPEKRELAQKWLHNLGRGHTVDKFNFGKHKVVCEDHFLPGAFVEDIRARLMGEKPRKLLKPDALPEVCVRRAPKKGTARSNRVLKKTLAKKDIASTSSKSARRAPPPSKRKSVITKRCDAQTQTDIVLCDAQCQTTDPNMDVNIIAMYTDHAYAKRQCEGGQLITIVSLAAGVGC